MYFTRDQFKFQSHTLTIHFVEICHRWSAGHTVVEMFLQLAVFEQAVGKVGEVDPDDGKGIAAKQATFFFKVSSFCSIFRVNGRLLLDGRNVKIEIASKKDSSTKRIMIVKVNYIQGFLYLKK